MLARYEWPDRPVAVGDNWDTTSTVRWPPYAISPTYTFCGSHWTLIAIEGDGDAVAAVLQIDSVCEGTMPDP